MNICRHNLSYASSSSVYGLNEELPFSTNHPISLYAASKKSNELILTFLDLDFLQFMALFTKAALEGRKIDVFNNGEMLRDFTYVEGIIR